MHRFGRSAKGLTLSSAILRVFASIRVAVTATSPPLVVIRSSKKRVDSGLVHAQCDCGCASASIKWSKEGHSMEYGKQRTCVQPAVMQQTASSVSGH